MPKIPGDPFQTETLRDKLAKTGKTGAFIKTYSPKFPSITNLNTPTLWDKLNRRNHILAKDSPMTFHKLTIISSFLPNRKIKVLNIGCGAGDLENVVFDKYKKNKIIWEGIDLSPKSVLSANKEFPFASFSVGDIRKIKKKTATYDYVILMEIMEHIEPRDTFKSLKNVYKILKKGGKLILSIPVNEGLDKMLEQGLNPNAHVRAYTRDIIETELKLSGFNIINSINLYAFSNKYFIKSFIVNWLLPNIKKPNNIVIIAEKI